MLDIPSKKDQHKLSELYSQLTEDLRLEAILENYIEEGLFQGLRSVLSSSQLRGAAKELLRVILDSQLDEYGVNIEQAYTLLRYALQYGKPWLMTALQQLKLKLQAGGRRAVQDISSLLPAAPVQAAGYAS